MICNQCNTANNDDAQFCSNCGAELLPVEQGTQPHKTRECPSCGYENTHEARYCAECGVELRHHQPQPHHKHHHDKQKPPKRKERQVDTRLKWHPALVVILIITGAVTFLAIPYITGKPPGQKPQPVLEQTSGDPTIETTVREIASKFICSCGTCGEQSLDACTCGTAVQERNFIRNAVQAGQSKELVVAAVNNTFGWMKPEFAASYDSTARKRGGSTSPGLSTGLARSRGLRVPEQKELGFSRFPKTQTGLSKIATAADRIEIFSHFKCPCGQCGIDELKDCGCAHPRGATEVKSFVDQKIAENKYTIAQITKQVEDKYGAKKF